jgi:hypothetical protein
MRSAGSADSHLQSLFSLLDEWKSLTLAETESIQAEDWKTLDSLQSRKSSLQPLIEELESKFFSSSEVSPEAKSAQRERLKRFAVELSEMEVGNRDMLSHHISRADKEIKDSNRSISSLRHVQQAYGTSSRSFWQTYS